MFHKKQLKNCFGFDAQPLKTYESNIPYTMRVMVDMDIVGGQWIRIPLAECEWIEDEGEAEKKKAEESFENFAYYRNRSYGATIVPSFTRKAETSIELSIDYQYVRPIPVKKDEMFGPTRFYDNSVAPMRTLGVDIECHGKDGHFPKPAYREEQVQKVLKDPNAFNDEQYERMIEEGGDEVIQIGNVFWDHGTGKQEKVIFVLGSCAPIEGATVYTFEDEREMLLRWRHFVRWIDPDIITGYNLVNFDLRYLMKRAAILGL
jgi:DNA polymerase delta subunit 1